MGRLLALLRTPGLPRVVYLTGPPGIGKTALTEAVRQRLSARGAADAVLIDSREVDGRVDTLDRLISEQAPPWPRPPGSRPLLLVLDGFDKVSLPQRRVLRRDIVEALVGPVLLVMCDRRAPLDLIAAGVGWRSVVEEMPLGPLSHADTASFLEFQGMTRDAASACAEQAHGNPLVLAIAGDIVRRVPDPTQWRQRLAAEVARVLVRRLRDEGADAGAIALVEVTSLQASVSEETLALMLGRDISSAFWRFADLSVVVRSGDGYSIADPFGALLARDLRRRRPDWCIEVEARASAAAGPDREAIAQPQGAPLRRSRPAPEALAAAKAALDQHRTLGGGGGSVPALHLGLSGDDATARLQPTLVDIVHSLMASRSPRVAEAGRVLDSYYFDRTPSHEAVAEQMSMSRATLFRRHSLGIELVAERLPGS